MVAPWARLAAAALLAAWAAFARAAPAPPELADPAGSSAPAPDDRGFLGRLPFIPVPELDTAPHSGVTLGLIPVFLSNDAAGQIDQILAPDIIHSQYFGWGARWRTFRYLSEDERWSIVGGAKQFVEREFDAEYDLGLHRDGAWSYVAHAMYDRSGTGRFYGLGNNSALAAQTTYIDSQIRIEGSAARNFSRALQLSYQLRADTAEIEQSALDSLPSIEQRYPRLPGVGDASEVQQRLVLGYDTRDSIAIPRSGVRIAAYGGFATRALGGSVDYAYYGVDATALQPVGPAFTLASHAALRYMPSASNAPFWALSSIGGDRSVIAEAQPLRAYGAGRFVDRNSFSASLEARTWVARVREFGTDLKLEVSPFVDFGKVFSAISESPVAHGHVGGGVGLRMVASPYVVGFLDFAYGTEKLAVFSGIDYPF